MLEIGETVFLSGPISGLNGEAKIALADSSVNAVFGQNTPVIGGATAYIGKGWCFGAMATTPLTQDNVGVGGSPLLRGGTGFTCDGSAVNNASQTDTVVGDLQFFAVQARNNAQFSCNSWTPVWTTPPTPSVTVQP